ncbi:hypothetical protein AKJ64_04060 [candidate division MSBL1 archaeon SCGC-AAA259E17]|uniref:DUS-like FMN-binding domain-containing protein n=1 Tax=candidate division MSBL1 archaeon SCGC-AAA259E17 TaxID=1698263 RepID=A0A133UD34_9EURY|nr:hypothetical protein AKJ64_04060 [candidate division MSBL1 archaeon SCGC-AAA259E17]
MMTITDGEFCAERVEGCSMVQIGAYMYDPPRFGEDPYFLPPDREKCIDFLEKEIEVIKRRDKNVFTCLNVAVPKLKWGVKEAKCFHKAGGDFVELNVHGEYEPYCKKGKLKRMVLPENREDLYEWVSKFSGLEVPTIIKFRKGTVEDYGEILEKLNEIDPFGVHFNVREEEKSKPDFQFVKNIEDACPFLMVSGYIRTAEDAQKLFKIGADMVGVAAPSRDDPDFLNKIANEYRKIRK